MQFSQEKTIKDRIILCHNVARNTIKDLELFLLKHHYTIQLLESDDGEDSEWLIHPDFLEEWKQDPDQNYPKDKVVPRFPFL